MTFARNVIFLIGSLALAGCGSSKEAELEKQLADAQAATAREAEARQAAESQLAALRNSGQSADLAEFYGSGSDENTEPSQMSDEDALTYRKPPPQILGPGG